jgi:hypothetical protein
VKIPIGVNSSLLASFFQGNTKALEEAVWMQYQGSQLRGQES